MPLPPLMGRYGLFSMWCIEQSLNKCVRSTYLNPSSSEYTQCLYSSQKPPGAAQHHPAVTPSHSPSLCPSHSALPALPLEPPSLPHVISLCSNVPWSWSPDQPHESPSCVLFSCRLYGFYHQGRSVVEGLKACIVWWIFFMDQSCN